MNRISRIGYDRKGLMGMRHACLVNHSRTLMRPPWEAPPQLIAWRHQNRYDFMPWLALNPAMKWLWTSYGSPSKHIKHVGCLIHIPGGLVPTKPTLNHQKIRRCWMDLGEYGRACFQSENLMSESWRAWDPQRTVGWLYHFAGKIPSDLRGSN